MSTGNTDREITRIVLVVGLILAIAIGLIVWSGVEAKGRKNDVDVMIMPDGKLFFY